MTKEEALNIVRNIYQTDAEKEALATLIPELKESEDERIRKDCIKYLDWEYQHCYLSDKDKIKIKKCIAWLEKHSSSQTKE